MFTDDQLTRCLNAPRIALLRGVRAGLDEALALHRLHSMVNAVKMALHLPRALAGVDQREFADQDVRGLIRLLERLARPSEAPLLCERLGALAEGFADGSAPSWRGGEHQADAADSEDPLGAPYLSIVATSRNDNHGGDLTPRMQKFLDGIFHFSAKYQLPTEVLLVEWNPPSDRPPLNEILAAPSDHSHCSLRYVTVPGEIHDGYRYAEQYPLYQMIAKNVGIRRARGAFVLSTNVDILLSDELWAELARRELKRGVMYRVDRNDVDRRIIDVTNIREVMEACPKEVTRINHRSGWVAPKSGERESWERLPREVSELFSLHTNGCGDFQLMDRRSWFALRGFPEWDLFSMHVDSVMENIVAAAGIPQRVFEQPMCAYHIEHDGGWSPEGGQDGSFEERLRKRRLGRLGNVQLWALSRLFSRLDRTAIFNPADWGLAGESLGSTPVTESKPGSGGASAEAVNKTVAAVPKAEGVDLSDVEIQFDDVEEVHGQWVDVEIALMLSGVPALVDEIRHGRPLYLWGAGSLGRRAKRICEREGVPVRGFIDSSSHRYADGVDGLPVLSPEGAIASDDSAKPAVKICTFAVREVEASLSDHGLQPFSDYF